MFWKYLPPKSAITDSVNAILDVIPGRQFQLSIHYRGTDKMLEAPLVKFQSYENAIQERVSNGSSLSQVFLATDDVEFELFIKARFPEINFSTFNLGTPSDASRGRHFSDMTPPDKAIESLVNMFLLAAAPICIRSTSYMSGVSKIINPRLRTITLNQTHWGSGHFPENEILAAERGS